MNPMDFADTGAAVHAPGVDLELEAEQAHRDEVAAMGMLADLTVAVIGAIAITAAIWGLA